MDRTNRNTALASALAEELARSGVDRAVICPGSRSTPVALALFREAGIETTSVVDERSAGFMALGAALASGKPVVVACTSGTAAANLHPAVAEAAEASVPLIALTSDRPPELRGVGAGQTIDQVKLYGSAVRWFSEVGTHAADDTGLLHMRSTACRAVAEASGDPRPGPVHLNLSWRDPLGPEPAPDDVTATSALALEGRGDLPLNAVHRPAQALNDQEVASIAVDLAGAGRGLIIAGRQTNAALPAAVVALAGATGFPVLAEPTSQLRSGSHARDRVVSAYDAILREPAPDLEPEVIVRFGDLPTSKVLRAWLAGLDNCLQLVVDPIGAWSEPTRRAALSLRAEPVALATALSGQIDRATESAFFDAWMAASRAAEASIADGIDGLDELTEPGVHAALASAYREGDVVFTASSMPIRDQEMFLPAGEAGVLFLSNRGANGIDGTVSSAVGASLATGRPAWIPIGDLALHHDSNGLALLRHATAPVRIVCLNNDGGGIFEFLPQADQVSRDEFEAIFGTPLGLDIGKLAALYGVEHRIVTDLGELSSPPAGHVLFEVRCERSQNAALHRRLSEAASQAAREAIGQAG